MTVLALVYRILGGCPIGSGLEAAGPVSRVISASMGLVVAKHDIKTARRNHTDGLSGFDRLSVILVGGDVCFGGRGARLDPGAQQAHFLLAEAGEVPPGLDFHYDTVVR